MSAADVEIYQTPDGYWNASVYAPTGELLGVGDDPRSRDEAIYRAFRDALIRGRVKRGDQLLPIAWYNPYTAEVELWGFRGNRSGDTRVYRFENPVAFPASGEPLSADMDRNHITISGKRVAKERPQLSAREVTRLLVTNELR